MALKISYCKLDLTANIIDFDQNFSTLFHFQKETKISFLSYFNLDQTFLDQIKTREKKSFILFCNTKINDASQKNALLLMYVVVEKSNCYYTIHLTNWLNWIHGIAGSLENGFLFISKFNDISNQKDFNTISDAACYKAFSPLLSYLPNKYRNGTTQFSLFEVMRVFVKLREMNFSRDYARNIYSRIRTSLKKEYGHNYNDAVDLIKNEELVNINFDGEILIPNTTLVSNMIFPTANDYFLMSLIDTISS